LPHGARIELIDKLEHSIALSIGIGASIEQNINKNSNDPRIWDTASAKLLNIQIINSTAFELITGMMTPKTPISDRTYVNAGLPCNDIYQEKPTKIAGSFGQVKTISEVDAAHDATPGTNFDPLRPTFCTKCRKAYVDSM
jgi:hypothetical protein